MWWSFNVNENHFIANCFIFYHVLPTMSALFPLNGSCCEFKGHFKGLASMNFTLEEKKRTLSIHPYLWISLLLFGQKVSTPLKLEVYKRQIHTWFALYLKRTMEMIRKEFSLAQRYTLPKASLIPQRYPLCFNYNNLQKCCLFLKNGILLFEIQAKTSVPRGE